MAAALNRDPLARRAFDRVGKSLGQAIADVVHLLGLSRVIIGGRFARAWEVFYPSLAEELHRRLTLFPPEAVSVTQALLGDDAGLLGAARLAWDLVRSEQFGRRVEPCSMEMLGDARFALRKNPCMANSP